MDSHLSELIAKVESASGPDRELDARIAEAAGWRVLYDKGDLLDKEPYYQPDPDISWRAVLRYTASIDAAMTLVPEGWRFGIEQAGAYDGSPVDEAWCWPHGSNFDPDWQNGQQGYRDSSDGARGYAVNPALALVAASLRALMGAGG